MDLPEGRTQILNILQIRRINRHPVDCDEECTPTVDNCSGPSLRVQVGVQTEPLQIWPSVLSRNANCQLGSRSLVNTQQVLIWAGFQLVVRWVHPYFHIRLLSLEYHNNILSKSRFRQPIVCFCVHCSLQYQLIWNRCFTFDILYFCLSGRSIIPLGMRRSVGCLDYQICKN